MRSVPGLSRTVRDRPSHQRAGLPNTQCGRDETDFAGAVSPAVLDYCNGIGTGAPDGPQNIVTGWNKREFDWQFGIGIQHEVVPRVSVEATYNRRWYGNFQLNDNISLGLQSGSGLPPEQPELREPALRLLQRLGAG